MTGFQPLSNYVLVEPIEKPDKTPSGILLPENTKDRPNQGVVVAIGEGQLTDKGERIPVSVQTGQNVLFQKYSGIEIKLNDKKYLIMRDTELLGVLVLNG